MTTSWVGLRVWRVSAGPATSIPGPTRRGRQGEGIAGNSFFVGEGTGTTTSDGICTAKTLTNLSDAEGLCPEAPRLEGGYDIAGLAYYARTESIRTDLTTSTATRPMSTSKTYGVTLSPAVPKIEVPVPGSSGTVVTILPACRNESIGGNCAIVDFKMVEPDTDPVLRCLYRAVYVNWEDSEQGGDYDQDMAGILFAIRSFHVQSRWTDVFADSTPNRWASATSSRARRRTASTPIRGSTSSPHTPIHRVAELQQWGDRLRETGEPWTSVTYTIGASTASLLEDPLYYASKWGGFEEHGDARREAGRGRCTQRYPRSGL